MTDDLVAFLRARLDDDARLARGGSGKEWWEHPKNWVSTPPLNRVALVVHDGDRNHILRHHPARVLREIEAKRKTLDDCEGIIVGWHHEESKDFARDVLRNLALPYADHDDFKEEWRV
jgi:hypothetical protein